MTHLKNRLLVVALLSLSAAIGWFAMPPIVKSEAHEQEMADIEKLHQLDIAATLAGDPQALADLFTDDAVLLEPGGQAQVGRRSILAEDEKEKAEHPEMKVLTYAPEIRDLKIADRWAFEWGYFSSSYRESPNGQAKSFRGKVLRVLHKQGDGSWKFARVMWNMAE